MTIFSNIVLFLALMPQASSSVGMVVGMQGDVIIQRGNSKTAAKLADSLLAGDQILTTAGQATFLYCPTGELVNVAAKSRIELGAKAIVAREGAAPSKSPRPCTLPKIALGAENLERVGALKGRGNPPIALFLGGLVSTSRPTFEWAAVAGTIAYQLSVRTPDGKVAWQQRTNQTSLVYPQSMPPLSDGAKYQWEVRAEGTAKTLGEQTATFEVKANRELNVSAGTDPVSQLLRAIELEEAGYFAEAAAAYRAVQASYPGDRRFDARLATLYWDAGLIQAAYEQKVKITSK